MEQIKAIYKFTEENYSQDEDMTKLLLRILRRFVIHYQIQAVVSNVRPPKMRARPLGGVYPHPQFPQRAHANWERSSAQNNAFLILILIIFSQTTIPRSSRSFCFNGT